MRAILVLGCAALLVAPALTPTPARAQQPRLGAESARDQARRLADEGQRLFEEGDYKGAAARLKDADARFPAPTIKLALAEAHEKLGELVEARAIYQRIAAETLARGAPAEFHDAQKVSTEAIARLDKAIPSVVLVLVGAAPAVLSLTLDGTALSAPAWNVPMPMNPGTHALVVEMSGRPAETLSIALKQGETRRVEVRAASGSTLLPARPAPAPVPDAPGRSYAAPVVAFGLGGAALVAGAITGGLALSKMETFRRECGAALQCPPSYRAELDGAKAAGHVSTVSFAIGGVGAAMGVALLLWPPGGGKTPVKVSVGSQGVIATGRF